ncbi:TetR/AcrR family transcriptional regulator [Fulvivirga sp. 29W222]|uniref:TetR/AcrR family transcriptional regulator n=1 Tax=Fulvivirga marina TaxID=2494733 RepID=A0A937KD91_9BACT|nr:TetR/AcrR family transcriptional regulator [Fulvivirga marina]MBL6445998.1 TetR/AcrR family transcriptional regulator [Fulvivirga marina]
MAKLSTRRHYVTKSEFYHINFTERLVMMYLTYYICTVRPQKIDDQTLLAGLKDVLSAKGYEGASLNELASSSGLQKASLYHRFPGGKKDIVLAVLNFVGEWIDTNIVNVLRDKHIKPEERLRYALSKIDELYNGGKSTCILRALSMDSGMDLFNAELNGAATKWIDSFHAFGRDLGMSEESAQHAAVTVLTKIQGSLVVSKMLDDPQVFKTAIKEIEEMYIKT